MKQRIEKLFKDNSLLIAISIMVLIAILSLVKLGSPSIQFTYSDKFKHALAYFVLSIVWFIAMRKKLKVVIVAIGCFVYGIIIEVLQEGLTQYRTGDYYDIIANGIGILIALLFFNFFVKKIELFKE